MSANKKIVLDGDVTKGLDAPSVAVHATGGVTINGKKIAVDVDVCDPHYGHTPHCVASSGITINGKKIVVDNDSTDCGDQLIASSSVTA